MTGSFVIDESSWIKADPTQPNFSSILQDFIGLIEEIREKDIPIYAHSDIYDTRINDQTAIYSFLWESDHGDTISHDTLESIMFALDRCHTINEREFELEDYTAKIEGTEYLSPGLCWAHLRSKNGTAVSPVSLRTSESKSGITRITVANSTEEVFFTLSTEDIKHYFRHAALFERFDETTLKDYVKHVFPKLDWADDVWQGLKVHKTLILGKHYDDTFHHLCTLNDAGCTIFNEHKENDVISRNLSANGVDASTENGNTRQDTTSRKARTKKYKGIDHEFWWHTKLSWNLGRIHFKYFGPQKATESDFIVIGLFIDHAHLPG